MSLFRQKTSTTAFSEGLILDVDPQLSCICLERALGDEQTIPLLCHCSGEQVYAVDIGGLMKTWGASLSPFCIMQVMSSANCEVEPE